MTQGAQSGTPLAIKLEIKPGVLALIVNSPKPYLAFFNEFPEAVRFTTLKELATKVDVYTYFY